MHTSSTSAAPGIGAPRIIELDAYVPGARAYGLALGPIAAALALLTGMLIVVVRDTAEAIVVPVTLTAAVAVAAAVIERRARSLLLVMAAAVAAAIPWSLLVLEPFVPLWWFDRDTDPGVGFLCALSPIVVVIAKRGWDWLVLVAAVVALWILGCCSLPTGHVLFGIVEPISGRQHPPMLLYIGAAVLAFGLLMMTRGWIYTFRPDGAMAQKRKRRNLKLGFTTDMKLFGRKVRRLGLIVAIVGGGLVGWKVSENADETAAAKSAPAATPAPGAPSAGAPAAP